ncbi:hypothetical protein E4H12_04395 [Candidatus Thorarchaeota archaeon]|nr:MAG: hypothetical protein E4H12_04395 [Candidatus Thorarchaeota archaeon]
MPVFPPGDVLRDLSFLLMGGVVFYSSLLAGILYREWYKNKQRRFTDIQFALATFLLGMVFNRAAFILSDFYFVGEPWNTIFTKIGYIGLILALTAFFFAMELMLQYRTRHIFFITGLLHAILAVIFPRDWLNVVAVSIGLITVIGVLLFLNFTMKNTSGDVRKSIKIIVAGFLLGYFGFIFASDMAFNVFGFGPYLLGEACLVVGIVSFGLGSYYSPALEELDWKQKLVELYFIQKGGLLVYHHEFERTSDLDEVLTAAGIAGIQSLFQEITKSESGLNVVSVGQFEILFSHSDTFTSVLITKAPYKILLGKLDEITHTFELMFANIIKNFEGSLAEFSSARDLVASIF